MNFSEVTFVIKVLVLSGALAAGIKYLAPYLMLEPSLRLAVVLLVAPAVLMAVLLWLQSRSLNNDS
ncbi:MAG: hypothetical protein HC929_02695 [Leptolyngbyaceae cyanobacterium SM2_5_2]|nr:hypothetical protein [Leptolyngbyaceae cyanobacterium SM2_5_2]